MRPGAWDLWEDKPKAVTGSSGAVDFRGIAEVWLDVLARGWSCFFYHHSSGFYFGAVF
jgi:hypothetical protein